VEHIETAIAEADEDQHPAADDLRDVLAKHGEDDADDDGTVQISDRTKRESREWAMSLRAGVTLTEWRRYQQRTRQRNMQLRRLCESLKGD
jgi:hypothetical protein